MNKQYMTDEPATKDAWMQISQMTASESSNFDVVGTQIEKLRRLGRDVPGVAPPTFFWKDGKRYARWDS
jgi:hypothetical protein